MKKANLPPFKYLDVRMGLIISQSSCSIHLTKCLARNGILPCIVEMSRIRVDQSSYQSPARWAIGNVDQNPWFRLPVSKQDGGSSWVSIKTVRQVRCPLLQGGWQPENQVSGRTGLTRGLVRIKSRAGKSSCLPLPYDPWRQTGAAFPA